MRPFASTPAARTKDTVIWSFNGQNCSFYNLSWINVRRSQSRAKYLEVGIPGFFSYLPAKFKNFRKFATRIMAVFGSTYVCEQLFSFVKLTKILLREQG